MFKKRGAVELSITTIVVIVIGVILLVLALGWVQGIFSKVTSLTDQAFRTGDKIIQEQMSSNAKFFVSGTTFEVEPGKLVYIYTGIQNFGESTSDNFKVTIKPGPQGGSLDWFKLPGEEIVLAGEKGNFHIVFNSPKNLTPGSVYHFTVQALKNGQFYASEPIIIVIK